MQSFVMDEYDGPYLRRQDESQITGDSASPRKPWLMIWFRCCTTYGRIYRNREGTRYSGGCPRCGGRVGARVGKGGTKRRIFEAE